MRKFHLFCIISEKNHLSGEDALQTQPQKDGLKIVLVKISENGKENYPAIY